MGICIWIKNKCCVLITECVTIVIFNFTNICYLLVQYVMKLLFVNKQAGADLYEPAPSLAYGKVHPALHRNGAQRGSVFTFLSVVCCLYVTLLLPLERAPKVLAPSLLMYCSKLYFLTYIITDGHTNISFDTYLDPSTTLILDPVEAQNLFY